MGSNSVNRSDLPNFGQRCEINDQYAYILIK